MILILSNDGDLSCDLVQDWLYFYRHSFIRVNSFDFLTKRIKISLSHGKISVVIGDKQINLEAINVVWFRKYGFFRDSVTYQKICETKKLSEEQINQIIKEFSKVINVLSFTLRDKNWLTDPRYINLNKVEVLQVASECGFIVPDTYIVNRKTDISAANKLISKSVLDPMIASWGDQNKSMMYTVKLNKKDLQHLPEEFIPSMLQCEILKDYELRVFYLCGEVYPMAIFSQKDKKTTIDFRNYNWDKPNRMVPCKLDTNTRRMIIKLMNQLRLNCGSLDLIKGKDGKIYFLEINPTGQFGMVDFPCNYELHKKVAEKLISMDN